MTLIIFRAAKTEFKTKLTKYLISNLGFILYDMQDTNPQIEQINLDRTKLEITKLLIDKKHVLLCASFFTAEDLHNYTDSLKIDSNKLFSLIRTKENNLPKNASYYDNEIVISEKQSLKNISTGILIIANTIRKYSDLIMEIQNTPDESILNKGKRFLNSTSAVLLSAPAYALFNYLIQVLKLYFIDNDKPKSMSMLMDLVKLAPVINFDLVPGNKFYRVVNYKERADYTHLEQIWYNKKPSVKNRLLNMSEPILFAGTNEYSSFLEVYNNETRSNPFIILEIEVLKQITVTYIAPIFLTTHKKAASNKMYMEYVKRSESNNSRALVLKEKLVRNFIGELMVNNSDFDTDTNYEFTNMISNFLLNRFKGLSIAYLSTQSKFQYNNFAIPASIADSCLKPTSIYLCKHDFLSSRPNDNVGLHLKRFLKGHIDSKTKKIVYDIKYY